MPTPEPEVAARMAERRFCEDCKHFQAGTIVAYHKCAAPQNESEKSPQRFVVRAPIPRQTFCEEQRAQEANARAEELCGPQGRWWEPKS